MLGCSSAPRSSLASDWMPRELRLGSHPVWISSPASGLRPPLSPPPRGFVSDGKEGRLPVSMAPVPEGVCPVWWPGPRRVGRTCGRKLWGDIFSGPPLLQALGFPGRRGSGLLASGLGRREGNPPPDQRLSANIPPKIQPGKPQPSSCCPDQNVPFSLNILYSFCFKTLSFNQGF